MDMFKHIFTYNLKSILRNKESVFWALLFPILLASFFYFAFGDLATNTSFNTINIAIVQSDSVKTESQFYRVLSSVSDIDGTHSPDDMFHVVKVTREEADELLEDSKISGYILNDEEIRLVVSHSGFNQTVLKVFLDEYTQTSSTIDAIIKENPKAVFKTIADVMNRTDYLKQTPASTAEGDVIVSYFYALLAMTCLIGSTVSVYEISKLQANISTLAARVNCSPVPKFKMFLYNISAMVLFQMVIIIIVLVYVMFVLGIDFGNRTGYVFLTCMIGSVTGVLFGTVTGVLGKSEGVKMAITIGGTLFGSFLAGLNAPMIKYLVQENIPLVSWINPASLITDALYSLHYYEDLSRFFINITLLLAISVLFGTITCLALRRKTYASI